MAFSLLPVLDDGAIAVSGDVLADGARCVGRPLNYDILNMTEPLCSG